MSVDRFDNGQRVRVTPYGALAVASESVRVADGQVDTVSASLRGMTGTVVRLRRADNGAWVAMDADLPDALRAFPVNDDRARHLLLYPADVESVD